MKLVPSFILLVFALFWCGIIAVLDAVAVPAFARQLRSTDFPTVTGRVVRSEVKSTYRSKGKRRHRPQVEYAYSVGGRDFTSSRITYGQLTFGTSAARARELLQDFPVGREVTVYYDPEAPAEAVLKPGVQAEHLFIALLATPHHLVGFALLMGALGPIVRSFRGGNRAPVLQPIDELRVFVRMPWLPPWAAGTIALGVATVATILVVALALPQPPTMTAAVTAWVVVIGIGGAFYLRQRMRISSGLADFLIDAGARTVTLPVGHGRKERLTIPFPEIEAVSFRMLPMVTTRRTKGGWTVTQKNAQARYELAVIAAGDQTHVLDTSADEGKLRGIAETLRDTFGWSLRSGAGAPPAPDRH